jgi:hypothetical protein
MLLLAKQSLDEAPYKLSGAVAKLAGITFLSLVFSWTDKPWFLTEGKFAAILIIPSSWGSQLDGDLHQHRRKQHRIRVSNKLKKEWAAADAAAEQQVPDPEQPGAIYEYDAAAGMHNGEGFAGTQDGAPNGGGMLKNAGYTPLRYVHPESEFSLEIGFCPAI